MNIRIGDIVRFISEKLEGKVTGIINNNTVNVFCDEYGFEIPASVNDLVVIHSDFKANTENSVVAGEKRQGSQKNVNMQSANTIYLAIVPDNFDRLPESRYELFIVNDTQQTCLYSAAFWNGEKYTGIAAGNCNSDSTSTLGCYSIKDIDNQIKAVNIQAVFFKKGTMTLRPPIDSQIKINTVSLCKSGAYKHSRWFEAISLLRPLDKEILEKEEISEEDIKQALKEKHENDTSESPRPARQVVGNILEIDLHIDQLVETTAGMDNKDMLEYQMDVFHKTLEEYKLRKGQKIVFIHGKGDGVLRQRILWELQTRYKRLQHQDASFKQYGYGATMVTVK